MLFGVGTGQSIKKGWLGTIHSHRGKLGEARAEKLLAPFYQGFESKARGDIPRNASGGRKRRKKM